MDLETEVCFSIWLGNDKDQFLEKTYPAHNIPIPRKGEIILWEEEHLVTDVKYCFNEDSLTSIEVSLDSWDPALNPDSYIHNFGFMLCE